MKSWLFVLLLLTPSLLQISKNVAGRSSNPMLVAAEEDEIDDEGVIVEEEEGLAGGNEEEDQEQEESENTEKKNVSPHADTVLVFTKPTVQSASVELPAGQIVDFLVGFKNKGETEFTVEAVDASFRYPQDFSYHIQNFTAISYMRVVKPMEEATFAYSFIPADAFAGRPIGFTVNLSYRDNEGNFFFDPVFNETVHIVEFDEGFDSEVFFMYLMLAAILVLVLFLLYSLTLGKSKGKKSSAVATKPVETGTAGDDVDYEWIPRSALRTPGSNKTSPRQRKGGNRNRSSDTE